MSWRVTFNRVAGADATPEEDFDLSKASEAVPTIDKLDELQRYQIEPSIEAAIILIESGVIGPPDGAYRVDLCGHANPEGSSRINNSVTVTVQCKEE